MIKNRSIRTINYKYIPNFEKSDFLYQILLDIERGLSGQIFKEKIKKKRSEEELYDLEKDPNEINNLANNTTYERIIIELRQKLFTWMKEIDDPLLKGKVKNE